jgi:hypothetical protein
MVPPGLEDRLYLFDQKFTCAKDLEMESVRWWTRNYQ